MELKSDNDMCAERYILSDGRRLRCGITTGTCAAAAAHAAVILLFTGIFPEQVRVRLPDGGLIAVPVSEGRTDGDGAACTVIKDAGDDPDITNGMPVCVRASRIDGYGMIIDGGEGVGRVTLPGLDQPVGAAAINSVPRQMIASAAQEALDALSQRCGLRLIVSLPEGKALAERTFNPRLGIVGGLSVLGTSGIVEPMSESAIVDTIRVEIRMRAARNRKTILLTPGNYGRDYLQGAYGVDDRSVIRVSNFISDALLCAKEAGFERVLLVGHLGKLVKLAGNMFNTHSRYGDCRMEILTAHAAMAGISPEAAEAVMRAATVDAALDVLEAKCVLKTVLGSILGAAQKYARTRVDMPVELLTFTNKRGELMRTGGFDASMALFLKEEG